MPIAESSTDPGAAGPAPAIRSVTCRPYAVRRLIEVFRGGE
ncbi:hypothetical protein ACFC1B_23500 [Streptomyces xiamenensis]